MKVETEVKNLKDYNSREHEEIKSMIKNFIDSADRKYASKIFERITYFIITACIGGIITKMIRLW